jgi:hypothetical protein
MQWIVAAILNVVRVAKWDIWVLPVLITIEHGVVARGREPSAAAFS